MKADASDAPTSPKNLRPESIPAELRALRQWVVWKEVVRGGEVAKPPHRALNHAREASVDDPASWATFEEAVACLAANPSVVAGVGFVFSDGDPYFGIDVDSLAKIEKRRALTPELRQQRETWVSGLLGSCNTYTERSPSGQGWHLICRGQLPIDGGQLPWGVELYGARRFFTITGEVHEGKSTITEQQEIASVLGGEIQRRRQAGVRAEDEGQYRPLERTDEQVLEACRAADPLFAARWEGREGAGQGEWSHTFFHVVACLDRATGRVSQVRRLVADSPLVRLAEPARSGEYRSHKAERILGEVLSRVRPANTYQMHHARAGRAIHEAMEEARRAEVALAVARAEKAVRRLSANAEALHDAFPQVEEQHKALCRPPGAAGEFVLACERACFLPFTKFAVPATMAALSGIVGRGYKLPTGQGINVALMLAGPSATGKTQTMRAWERFCGRAAAELPATPAGPQKSRIVATSTSSIQAMMEEFQEQPSCAWFNAECGAQLRAMSEVKTVVDAALRDSFNNLYDCAEHYSQFSPPRSVALRKAAQVPIANLSVSIFWTTTIEKFSLSLGDVLDGFLSRVVVVRHAGPAGNTSFEPAPGLPDHLHTKLRDLMGAATNLDNLYRTGRAEPAQLFSVDTSAVEGTHRELIITAETIKNRALAGDLPASYGAVSRLPLTALRLAALLAVLDSPYAPQVTHEQLSWSFGYVLQNAVDLLSDVDRGTVGRDENDEVLALVRVVREMMINPKYKHELGVERRALHNRLRATRPFSLMQREQSAGVTKFLRHALEEGLVQVAEVPGARGAPKFYVSPSDNPIWED